MIKLSLLFAFVLIFTGSAHGQIRLVGNKVETFIYDNDEPARLIEVVSRALELANIEHEITATTQAWSGSGLRSGKYQGYIDHYSLNNERSNYIFSEAYVEVALHVASTSAAAFDVNRFDQLHQQRIGIEKRFANTDRLRTERDVKWARRDTFYENIQQLSEGRVDYVLADKIMLQEMNKLLTEIDQETLYISEKPILRVQVKLALNKNLDGAETLLKSFDDAIRVLRTTGQLQDLYQPSDEQESLLDAALYKDILRKW